MCHIMKFVRKILFSAMNYPALKDVYLARNTLKLSRALKKKEWEGFEKSRTYKRWKIRLRMNILNGNLGTMG